MCICTPDKCCNGNCRVQTQGACSVHNVFAYGTLRKREERQHWMNFIHDTGKQVRVQGFLYDLGWFPALRLEPDGYSVLCDVIQVDDDGLSRLDDYEGFIPDSPDHSFYVRHLVNIDGLDGFIYEFHEKPDISKLILGPDWLIYRQEKEKQKEYA